MTHHNTLRFGAQTDSVTSLLRIVNLVRSGEAITRPEIGRVTDLSRGVVTQRITQAISMGFLVEDALAPSTGGRAARTLRFNAERGRIIVCALGALHINVGLTDLDGQVIGRSHAGWDVSRGPDETLAKTFSLVDALLEEDRDETENWAVVVGLPGPVDFETGSPVAPPIMPGWGGFDVRGCFEERYDAPVWVDNDTNLLVLSERHRFEDGTGDLIYFKLGSGIGTGLLSRGRIHRGANGTAGDIGHVPVPGATEICRCGKTGCLEAVASGWALVRDARRALEDGAKGLLAERVADGAELDLEQITLAARDGDPFALGLVEHSARLVGDSIATLVNIFNPSTIVVGGAIAGAGEVFLAEVRQQVYSQSLPLATRDLVITTSASDRTAPIRGGAALAIEELFEITFPRWFAEARPTVELTRS